MKLENHDLETAKMTVVCNIQLNQEHIRSKMPYDQFVRHFAQGFDELWAMSLKELRELQDNTLRKAAINKGDE